MTVTISWPSVACKQDSHFDSAILEDPTEDLARLDETGVFLTHLSEGISWRNSCCMVFPAKAVLVS